jgi:hypothetical protein
VWKSTDDDPARVVITFKRFLFAGAATSQALYGPFVPGQYVGVNAVQAEGTLQDGGHLAGSFTTQFTNLTNLGGGPPTFAGTGTFTATRLIN